MNPRAKRIDASDVPSRGARGQPETQNDLGVMHLEGEGGERDPAKAFAW